MIVQREVCNTILGSSTLGKSACRRSAVVVIISVAGCVHVDIYIYIFVKTKKKTKLSRRPIKNLAVTSSSKKVPCSRYALAPGHAKIAK